MWIIKSEPNGINEKIQDADSTDVSIFNSLSRAYAIEYIDIIADNLIDAEIGQLLIQRAQKIGPAQVFDVNPRDQKIINLEGYYGYQKYFNDYIQDIGKMLKPSKKMRFSETFSKIYKQLKITPQSVAVHVRRGDLKNYYEDGNRITPIAYQIKGMSLMAQLIREQQTKLQQILQTNQTFRNPTYFIYSDDPVFIRSAFENTADTVIVSDGKLSNIEEFFLMLSCDHFIIPTTTFSWWPAVFSAKAKQNKIVIVPKIP
eukprot:403349994